MTKRTFTKYPSSYISAAKKKTQIETVMDLLEANNYSIPIDSDGYCDFKVVTVDKENFPDMPESLETQLNREGKYGDYVAIIMGPRPLTIAELPIYGEPNRWVTKWIYSTPEEAVKQMLGERGIKLFKRISKYPGNNITASTLPSYQNADYTRYDHYRSEGLPQGKVLIVSEDKNYQTANGFCCTTEYGDIFGSNDVYYLLTDDGTLYRTQSRYRDFSYHPNFFEKLFENGGFVKCFNDYWLNYKSN